MKFEAAGRSVRWAILLGLIASTLGCKGSGAARGEGTECRDQSDCAQYHLVCAAPPGVVEGDETGGLCVAGIPPGSCAFYVRQGVAKGQFCAD